MALSVVRVRSSHQITAAMAAPTVTEIARRMAGTLNGPDSCAFSMYPSAKRSTWYSMSVSRPAAAPIAMPTTATAAISAGILPILAAVPVCAPAIIRTIAFSLACTLHIRLVLRVTAPPSFHRRWFVRPTSRSTVKFQIGQLRAQLAFCSERPIRLVVLLIGNRWRPTSPRHQKANSFSVHRRQ